jgi:hypothetical protein
VFRNLRATFTKKQDTTTVLKELVSGIKEAKDSVIKKKTPESKAAEVIEVQPIDEKPENSPKPQTNGNGKKRKKSEKSRKPKKHQTS